ncbi:GMC oxidoreductase domain-containing protein [Phthorimaea operculella]|nr:GMC oxidoreductase domain-containing protein [Phthorimaea operculella]
MLWQPLNLTAQCIPPSQLPACTYLGYIYLDLLVKLYGGSREKRKHTMKESEGGDYDFIVVGAGSAGCVVANRLTEIDQWKVLLLEAGPEQPDVSRVPAFTGALLGSNIDWNYQTEPNGKSCLARPGQRCDWPRGKTMGGSSSVNDMVYVRGNKLDYDNWAAMGNEGWSYKDVLPFFKKSENNLNMERLNRKYHGVHGEQPIARFPYIDQPSIMLTEAFYEGGLPILDFNGEEQQGTMQAQAFSEDGERVSTNTAFIEPIRHERENLVVKPDSEAVQILFDNHKRAYGIKYVRNGKTHLATAKKDIIISSGAINSPKLLLLSGIGPKKQLEDLHIPLVQDLPVGENLHDHVTFSGIDIALPNRTATTVSHPEIIESVKEFKHLEYKRGPLSANGPSNSLAFLKTNPNLPAPDIQYQFDNVNWKEYYSETFRVEQLQIFPTCYYDAVTPRIMNLVPKSRGKLVLNPKNPQGKPLLQPNYFGDPTDLMPLIKGARFIYSLENTHAFKSRGAKFVKEPLGVCRNLVWGTDEYTECLARSYTYTTYHPVGTCKMGPNWDRTAVVDPRLRVYGVSGLRVIDSSIMPVVTRGNTNAPSIMIGERGVELVKEDWLHNYFKH